MLPVRAVTFPADSELRATRKFPAPKLFRAMSLFRDNLSKPDVSPGRHFDHGRVPCYNFDTRTTANHTLITIVAQSLRSRKTVCLPVDRLAGATRNDDEHLWHGATLSPRREL